MMNLHAGDVLYALLFAAAGGLVGWLVTTPLRRRSLGGLVASLVVTASATSTAGVVGSVHSMLFPAHEHAATLLIIAGTAVVATVAALAAMRRLSRDSAVLRAAIADVGAGRVPADEPPLSGELERTRRELREAAVMLAEARRREQALEASRRELVSWVSHDLRTPLAGLRAIAEALEDGVVDDPALYYKRILESVARLSTMVDDLFDLSRIQAGRVSAATMPVPLADLASDVVAALEPLATASRVSLSGQISATPAVAGNADELNRAVTNLVANAIRHTRSGGTVVVAVELAGAAAELSVQDECGGIAPADVPRLFDVGFRATTAREAPGPHPAGAGLGLAITRGIVEAYGGTVDVRNSGPGCVFRVRLPHA